MVWPAIDHFVTAELRYRTGLDPEPVGLGSQVVANFDTVAPISTPPETRRPPALVVWAT